MSVTVKKILINQRGSKQKFLGVVEVKLDHFEFKSVEVFLKSNFSINMNLGKA